MNKKLQIVIDVQNDFVTDALHNEEVIKKIPNIVARIKAHDGYVISTYDTHFDETNTHMMPENVKKYFDSLEGEKLPVKHCIKLTKGWEYVPEVLEALQEKNKNGKYMFHSVDKYTFGFNGWKEKIDFYGAEEIEMFGFCTDNCIISNALIIRALYPNMPIKIVENCCAGVTLETHKAALEVAKMCQIDVI